jgi:GNAT-family acetyltransferase (TIGR03103 family)
MEKKHFDPNRPSLKSWGDLPETEEARKLREDVVVQCGWGRLIFGHTFRDPQTLADEIRKEQPGRRDIALYLRDPHVVLSLAPNEIFLDPSHTYRLYLSDYVAGGKTVRPFDVEPIEDPSDVEEMSRIYKARRMVPPDPEFVWAQRQQNRFTYLVARTRAGQIIGCVIGVDHVAAFEDPENGCSLWCLAVDPQTAIPGVGEALVRGLVEHYAERERTFLDLSVLHTNRAAIGLYERLGFRRVPVFCMKNRNVINESLYTSPRGEEELNPYARIITEEAHRRGIKVEVLDPEANYFRLTLGGRSIICRESLTELTSAIAMSRCADKGVTARILKEVGLKVPDQQTAATDAQNAAFLHRHGRVVVKPIAGEQGQGVSVDVRTEAELERAIRAARRFGSDVMLEQFVTGLDLRVIVIDRQAVAAAVRRPPEIIGNGQDAVRDLIEALSRRRRAQTGGESHVPLDAETQRVVASQGYLMDSILPEGTGLIVRNTANLHTGGTIEDVTPRLHPTLAEVSVRAAEALDIPVTGLDLLVPEVSSDEYTIIEANERPGLANHEPQPTAERFVDFLLPQSVAHPLDDRDRQ